jgi:iron complex transport system substrate-binding protein
VHAAGTSREIDEQVRGMSAGGAALYEIDSERLAALRPDLIVTQAQCDVCAVRYADVVCAVETLPALRGTQVVALNPQTYGDIFDDIVRVGQAAGCPAEGARLAAALKARVAAVAERTARLPPGQRPRVVGLEWLDPIMVAGNWMPEMIALAGGVPGSGVDFAAPLTSGMAMRDGREIDSRPLSRHSAYVPWPTIVAEDPEVIIVMPCGFDLERTLAEAALLPGLPGWHDLLAVRAGRVYAVDGNAYFNRSGPRMVDSLEILAHLIHPDAHPPPADRKAYAQVD